MALTAAQTVDCRRYMGYPLQGGATFDASVDTAYAWIAPGQYVTLYTRLTTLSASEETVLTGKFLTPLATLETAIIGAGANLDTDQAAVWKRNVNEVADRQNLYAATRKALCSFLGFEPGPALGQSGSMRLTRC